MRASREIFQGFFFLSPHESVHLNWDQNSIVWWMILNELELGSFRVWTLSKNAENVVLNKRCEKPSSTPKETLLNTIFSSRTRTFEEIIIKHQASEVSQERRRLFFYASRREKRNSHQKSIQCRMRQSEADCSRCCNVGPGRTKGTINWITENVCYRCGR